MIEEINRNIDKSIFRMKVNESFKRMIDCMLIEDGKTCKNCSDVDTCVFLTEAVFSFRTKYLREYHTNN